MFPLYLFFGAVWAGAWVSGGGGAWADIMGAVKSNDSLPGIRGIYLIAIIVILAVVFIAIANWTQLALMFVQRVQPFMVNTKYVAFFNGYNSVINIPNSAALQQQVVTITSWIKLVGPGSAKAQSGSTDFGWIVGKWSAWGIAVCGQQMVLCYYSWGDPHLEFNSNMNLTAGRWYFVTAVVSNSTETLYLDGVNVYSGAYGLGNQDSPVQIGAITSCCNEHFNGSIADVQIYNTDLSPGQISQMYSEGIGGAPVDRNGLIGWWPLNGNFTDISGFGDNGVPGNVSFVSPN